MTLWPPLFSYPETHGCQLTQSRAQGGMELSSEARPPPFTLPFAALAWTSLMRLFVRILLSPVSPCPFSSFTLLRLCHKDDHTVCLMPMSGQLLTVLGHD